MSATVSRLPATAKPRKPRPDMAAARRPSVSAKAARRMMLSGVSVLSVAAVLTGLSLSHLAHGIETTTGTSSLDAWAMAVGIDVGFIATEAAVLCAVGEARATVERWAGPTVLALVILSAAMNAFAFASSAPAGPLYAAVAAALGVTIPVLVYVLSRVGYALLTRGA